MVGKVDEKYITAAHRALAAFPVTPSTVDLVWQSENITFRVFDANTQSKYVLRLHRWDYHTLNELNSERAWTLALNDAGITAPHAVLTRSGTHFHTVDIPGEAARYAGMTLWLEGTPLVELLEADASDPAHEDYFRQIGALAATLHTQAGAWPLPDGFERQALDKDGLIGATPFWGNFWEHAQLTDTEKQMMLQMRTRMCEILDAYGQNERNFGLIHADLHCENILLTEDGVAPIDFDDAGFGWHMYDLAVILFAERDRPQFEVFKDAVLVGYQSLRPLSKTDLDMLPVFILLRAMVLIGWLNQRPELADDAYFQELRDTVMAGCRSP
jgi:Ser/Thr protein kinase RdoA (MazF antagonist)